MRPTLATISLLVALHHHTSLNVKHGNGGNGNHQDGGTEVQDVPDGWRTCYNPLAMEIWVTINFTQYNLLVAKNLSFKITDGFP